MRFLALCILTQSSICIIDTMRINNDTNLLYVLFLSINLKRKRAFISSSKLNKRNTPKKVNNIKGNNFTFIFSCSHDVRISGNHHLRADLARGSTCDT